MIDRTLNDAQLNAELHTRIKSSIKRSARALCVSFALASLVACSSIPLPPAVPPFPAAEQTTKGIPTAAYTSFEMGVKELEKQPPNYIEAIKFFERALKEYDASRTSQIGARDQHKRDLEAHQAALAAWVKEHGPGAAEDPKLQAELKQRREGSSAQSARLGDDLLDPDYIVARLNLAYTSERLGRYEDAVKAYKVLLDKGVKEQTILLAYGRSLLLSGRAKESITYFNRVLGADPDSLSARNNLSAAYLSLGDLDKCLKYVKEVLARQPKDVSAMINLGLLYLKDKNYDRARFMFQKAIMYDEVNAKAHSNLGLVYYRLDQLPLAVTNFQKALNLDPTVDEARINLASIYLDYLDYKNALDQFNIVLSRFPTHYQALVGAADCLYGVGQYKEAVKFYLESIKVNNKNPEVYYRLAKLYEEKMSEEANHKDTAVGYYETFIKLENPPADAKVRTQLANLKALIELEKNPPPGMTQGDDSAEGDDAAEGAENSENAEGSQDKAEDNAEGDSGEGGAGESGAEAGAAGEGTGNAEGNTKPE